MKMFLRIASGVLILSLFITPQIAVGQFLSGTKRPFGAQVLSTTIPGITCAAQYGAILLRPVVPMSAAPYFIRTSQRNVSSGSWLLGWYNMVPDMTTCTTTTTPPAPVTSFEIQY